MAKKNRHQRAVVKAAKRALSGIYLHETKYFSRIERTSIKIDPAQVRQIYNISESMTGELIKEVRHAYGQMQQEATCYIPPDSIMIKMPHYMRRHLEYYLRLMGDRGADICHDRSMILFGMRIYFDGPPAEVWIYEKNGYLEKYCIKMLFDVERSAS